MRPVARVQSGSHTLSLLVFFLYLFAFGSVCVRLSFTKRVFVCVQKSAPHHLAIRLWFILQQPQTRPRPIVTNELATLKCALPGSDILSVNKNCALGGLIQVINFNRYARGKCGCLGFACKRQSVNKLLHFILWLRLTKVTDKLSTEWQSTAHFKKMQVKEKHFFLVVRNRIDY